MSLAEPWVVFALVSVASVALVLRWFTPAERRWRTLRRRRFTTLDAAKPGETVKIRGRVTTRGSLLDPARAT